MFEKNKFSEVNNCIAKIWDNNVQIRADELEKGTDYSYTKIIQPYVLNEVESISTPHSSILDIGCGCGYLTNAIFEYNRPLIKGIDLSGESISYCSKKYPHISFLKKDLYSLEISEKYDVCIAVMAVNNMPDELAFFEKVSKIINQTGKLFVILPHPCFWPVRHICDDSFDYSIPSKYLTPFSTKGRLEYISPILYFHRPLESYINCIERAGFHIEKIKELSDGREFKTPPDILSFILSKL